MAIAQGSSHTECRPGPSVNPPVVASIRKLTIVDAHETYSNLAIGSGAKACGLYLVANGDPAIATNPPVTESTRKAQMPARPVAATYRYLPVGSIASASGYGWSI